MMEIEEEIANIIAKGDIYYHSDAHGFFRVIEEGVKWSLCSVLTTYFSDATTTICRYLIKKSHIKKFATRLTDIKQLTVVSNKVDNYGHDTFRITPENKDLHWYWEPYIDDGMKSFVKKIDIGCNELPGKMKIQGCNELPIEMKTHDRPDIFKRLETIGKE